jgi:hypothetical protein
MRSAASPVSSTSDSRPDMDLPKGSRNHNSSRLVSSCHIEHTRCMYNNCTVRIKQG